MSQADHRSSTKVKVHVMFALFASSYMMLLIVCKYLVIDYQSLVIDRDILNLQNVLCYSRSGADKTTEMMNQTRL